MADQPEKMEEELQLLRERRRQSRCHRTYSLLLEGLETATGLPREQAQRAFVQVLCALERPLVRDTADEWRARLPVRVQEAIEACASRRRAAPEDFHLEAVLGRLEADLGVDRGRAESVARALLATLRAHLTESEASQLEDALPWEFRALWGRAC